MKRLLVFLSFAFVLESCTKNGGKNSLPLAEDSGCINRLVIPVTAQGTLTDADFNLVKNLFTANGINFKNFRFSRTYRDSVQTYAGTFDYRNVYIIQYTNGLPLFGESLNYLFRDQVFYNLSGALTKGAVGDTIPILKLSQLRKLFIDDIQQFDNRGLQYKDSCLYAEFGYFNLNGGISNTPEDLVKAWHVTPLYNSYPEAYYLDQSGKRVLYFNGLETFR